MGLWIFPLIKISVHLTSYRSQNSEARINRDWLLFIKMTFSLFILNSEFWLLTPEFCFSTIIDRQQYIFTLTFQAKS